ncbi:molybdate ABC transporter permease subunit [Staphylococcus intermedius]|uniref:Molybdenum transport system permease n=1 Tax=Staphylococcus intermedius NCTC 11048 TaxID=1141106 RepID=A0A380G5G1_STAIN|nr:molybdate ABC transporter permease subunit [Staphylococcus intermedius]PCF63720.1 molybdenum ABC transporter permease subunit [Staphylococcus intermedius]PCF78435.1 molybdenum ABC transporter permease subunit [Staphylococcus intermedius]PCF79409.1 molybdenum ABC transporter permease subunit [Staphylococcus intermedius]PCF86855.1 molybdenum ABC transporter permease subunit [Staphylococcus intermedius]PCF89935.1 molybdenum ABC transporter permease subunit [Staphylococcus intermedius]
MSDFTPFWISLRVALVSTVVVFILGIALARIMYHRRTKWTHLIESIVLLPIVLPPTVLGFLLLMLFSVDQPVGHLLTDILGVKVVFTWIGAVVASVIVSFPLMYQHTVQGFRNINPRMLNTARTMGASELKIFFKITLPLSKRAIISGMMLAFARAIGEFGATLMIAGYIPGKTNTLPLEIYFLVQQGRENQAWLWVLVLVAFAISVIGTMNVMNRERYREVD